MWAGRSDAEASADPGLRIGYKEEAQVGSGLGTQGPRPRTPDGSSLGAAEAGGLGPHGAPGSMTIVNEDNTTYLILVDVIKLFVKQ